MIFVTVGTHEQPFNRIIKCVDELKGKNIITEDVIIQSGFSTYEAKYCVCYKLLPYQEMIEKMEKARIIITHGGPSSFMMPLQIGKIPIVVPRQKKFGEHINDHQLEFVRKVAKRHGTIIDVENIDMLESVFLNYDKLILKKNAMLTSNNEKFNREFEKIVESMFGYKD